MIDPQKCEELTEQREVRGRVKQERCSDSPLRRRKRLQKCRDAATLAQCAALNPQAEDQYSRFQVNMW